MRQWSCTQLEPMPPGLQVARISFLSWVPTQPGAQVAPGIGGRPLGQLFERDKLVFLALVLLAVGIALEIAETLSWRRTESATPGPARSKSHLAQSTDTETVCGR